MIEFTATVHQTPERMTPDLLGGKGYHLAVMRGMGLPVPDAAIITTEFFAKYYDKADIDLTDSIVEELMYLTDSVRWTIDHGHSLISIRSGAKISMPGMMDTILNVGITSKTKPGLIKRYGAELVEELEVRLITMYADVVFGVDVSGCTTSDQARNMFALEVGIPFFDTVEEQVINAITAIFTSWYNDRAVRYREIHGIPHDMGTAVVLQKMVYGNKDEYSGTGVYFTGCPNTGSVGHTGEFLPQAQGEDVVSGEVTPLNIDDLDLVGTHSGFADAFVDLATYATNLNTTFKDMQDIEFTIESGKLYILQTRSAKRTDRAAINYCLNVLSYPGWTPANSKAFDYLTPAVIGRMFKPKIDPSDAGILTVVAEGLSVGGGIAQGQLAFSRKAAKPGTIFVAEYTTPDDLDAMIASDGIITQTGGATSHAAIVARSLGKPAVVGTGTPVETLKAMAAMNADHVFVIDGDKGNVYQAVGVTEVALSPGTAYPEFLKLAKMLWDVELEDTTKYVRPFPDMESPSCVEAVFGIKAPVAATATNKIPVTEDEIPQALKQFLSEVHLEDEVLKTILSKGFRVEESCYDKDPVLVALTHLSNDKD